MFTKVNPESAHVGIPELGTYLQIESDNLNETTIDWIIIKIFYNDSELPPGVDESSLRLYWFNETSGAWEVVTPGGVNTVENYIWGNVSHLSTFGAAGKLSNGESCTSNNECASGICCNGVCASSCCAGEAGGQQQLPFFRKGDIYDLGIFEGSKNLTLMLNDKIYFMLDGEIIP